MIDLVYIVGTGSHWEDNELRYSMRSVERHLKGVGKVWIVGHVPEWLDNIHEIKMADISQGYEPEFNVMTKLKRAAESYYLSEDFLFMNDDFFFLSDMNATEIPYFYDGTIQDWLAKRSLDRYGHCANNTLKELNKLNRPTKNFELHYPMVFNKEVLGNMLPAKHSLTIRSLYANMMSIEGVQSDDCKSDRPPLPDAKFYSTKPKVNIDVQKFLLESFPNPSKYERS